MFSFIILITILLLLLFLLFFIVAQFYSIIFKGFAPFISSGEEVLHKVISEINAQEKTVFELGCGRAGFLRSLRKKYPKARLIGVELLSFPYLVAQIQNSLSKSGIEIRKEDIFKTDISKADIIYCYLNVDTMRKLEPKFKTECKKGAQIVSFQFKLPSVKPERTIELDEGKNKVYFYTIK